MRPPAAKWCQRRKRERQRETDVRWRQITSSAVPATSVASAPQLKAVMI